MHFSFFKARRLVQARLIFLILGHRKQIYDQLGRIWIDRINTKIAPVTTFLLLVLVSALSLLPVFHIHSLKDNFSYFKEVPLFVPRGIEERNPGYKSQKELLFLDMRKNNLERGIYTLDHFFSEQNRKIFNINNAKNCLKAFKLNNLSGMILFISILFSGN